MNIKECYVCYNKKNVEEMEYCERDDKTNIGCNDYSYCLECKDNIINSRLKNKCPLCRKNFPNTCNCGKNHDDSDLINFLLEALQDSTNIIIRIE